LKSQISDKTLQTNLPKINSMDKPKKDHVTYVNPQAHHPGQVFTEQYAQNGWKFIFKKSAISPSKDLDQMSHDLKLQGIPDIVYGNSSAQLIFEEKNFVYEILAKDALQYANYEKRKQLFKETYDETDNAEVILDSPVELKIKEAQYWKDKKVSKDADIKVLEKISDWSYSTPYRGSVRIHDMSKKEVLSPKVVLKKTDDEIPLGNLTQKNPIKWFGEFTLFEDELGDCGLT